MALWQLEYRSRIQNPPIKAGLGLAGGEGFEPPHTDPESAVLPLDEPPERTTFYHEIEGKSNKTIPSDCHIHGWRNQEIGARAVCRPPRSLN